MDGLWQGVAAALLLSASACAPTTVEESDQALACAGPGQAIAGEVTHGFTAPVPVREHRVTHPIGETRVVYLNRGARTYVAGIDDAEAGASSVVSAQGLASATLGGFQQGDDEWRALRSCLREQFARYDVAITDIRPVGQGYIEAHFGGRGTELGITTGAGGIAPIDNSACDIIDGAPVFVFSDLFGSNIRALCEVGAHEIAHTFSLDHAYRCKDPMTYVEGCGEKEFQEEASPCGEGGPRACICGRASQSSVVIMRDKLGDRRSDTAPPTVEMLQPVANPRGQGTLVQVRAHDADAALAAIELHLVVDGDEQVTVCGEGPIPCSLDAELANFAVPSVAADVRVWAVAQDTGGNRASSLETVLRAQVRSPEATALAVAPIAATYDRDGVVELQALVVSKNALQEVVAIWRDGDGETRSMPMCPSSTDGRWGTAIHLGRGAIDRSFFIRVTDADGNVTTSVPETVSLRL